MGKATVVALVAFCAVIAIGCGTGRFVQRGIDRYNAADLSGAMGEWRNVESIEGELNPKGRMRYLVYRGLTHYERGERAEALYFLSGGLQAYDRGDSAWLPLNIAAKMDYALADLTGAVVPPPAPPFTGPAPGASVPAPR